jgi:hypothetical protein
MTSTIRRKSRARIAWVTAVALLLATLLVPPVEMSFAAACAEPNDQLSQACAVADGSVMESAIDGPSDNDLYQVHVPNAAQIHAELTVPGGTDYDLYLHTGTSATLGQSVKPGSETESIQVQVQPGTYFVRVSVTDGNPFDPTAQYTLRVWIKTEGPDARITSPADGSNVPGEVTAQGSARNVPGGQTLWCVVHIGGLYWPQKPVTRIGDNWTCLAGFGGGAIEHNGKKFDLLLVMADGEANKAWVDWLTEGAKTGNFPGMLVLPSGVTPLDQVTVALRVP